MEAGGFHSGEVILRFILFRRVDGRLTKEEALVRLKAATQSPGAACVTGCAFRKVATAGKGLSTRKTDLTLEVVTYYS